MDTLQEDKFVELVKCLDTISFKRSGSMNVAQVYLAADESTYPDIVREVRRVLGSEAMMVLLSDLTNLGLHGSSKHDDSDNSDDESDGDGDNLEESGSPARKKTKIEDEDSEFPVGTLSSVELRQWKSGCYSLLRDGDKRCKESRLELFYSIGFPTYDIDKLDCGGFYSYFADGEDEEVNFLDGFWGGAMTCVRV